MPKSDRQLLIEIGWGEEGADFLLSKRPHPVIEKLLARIKGEKWHPPDWKPKNGKAFIPRSLAKQVFERDAYRCVSCGGWRDLSIDHKIPESKGGATTLENLQTMCMPCNRRKGAK
jgi:hypothetical protein